MWRTLLIGLILPAALPYGAVQDEPDKPLSIPHILNIPVFSDFTLSPDGKRVAVTSFGLGEQRILVFSNPEEPGVAVATGKGRDREPDWSAEGGIAFASNRDGNWHIYVADPDKEQDARQVTRHQGNDSRPRWSPDGKRLAYLSHRLGSETGWDLWVSPLDEGKPSRLTKDPMDEQDPRWSPDGKQLAYTFRAGRHVNRSIGVVSAWGEGAPESRELFPEGWEGDSHSPRWSPDGKQIAFVSDHNGRKAIYLVSAEGGEPKLLMESEFEETDPAWSPDGTEIVHRTNREGNLRLSVTSASTGEGRLLTLGSGVHSKPQWTPGGEAIACFYEGPAYPRNVWLFQRQGGRTRMTENMPKDLDPRQLIRPEIVRYPSFDETTITGYLYLPTEASAENPVPLIVHPHGGPTSQWRNAWHPFVQFLAQRGFAIFAPNVRGSTGFGLPFENLNDRDWGRGDLEDLVIGTRTLIKRPEIRDDRIAIWGVSYGGFLTLAALGSYPGLFTCAIESVGMPDLEKLYRETNTEGRAYLDREIGPLRGNLQLYRDLSPVRNVNKIKTPLLTFHGMGYTLVPFSTKRPFLTALKKPGYPLQDYLFREDWARSTYRYDIYPGATRLYWEKILEFIQIYL